MAKKNEKFAGKDLEKIAKISKILAHVQNEKRMVSDATEFGVNLIREIRFDEAMAKFHEARAELDKLIAFASELA